MDGRFKYCSTLFSQLFAIYGSVERGNNQMIVPLVYTLMNLRDGDLYIQMFKNTCNFSVENKIYIEKNSNLVIITDFEYHQ